MAAIFFTSSAGNNTIFRSGFAVNNSVYIPFLQNLIGSESQLIVTEVTMQHRDTLQFFNTFDDFVNYYYFGKGLGSMAISGMVFSDCLGQFGGLYDLQNTLAYIRGSTQNISFGNVAFQAVMNAFTLRASADMSALHSIDFNIQMDVIDSSMPPAQFTSAC